MLTWCSVATMLEVAAVSRDFFRLARMPASWVRAEFADATQLARFRRVFDRDLDVPAVALSVFLAEPVNDNRRTSAGVARALFLTKRARVADFLARPAPRRREIALSGSLCLDDLGPRLAKSSPNLVRVHLRDKAAHQDGNGVQALLDALPALRFLTVGFYTRGNQEIQHVTLPTTLVEYHDVLGIRRIHIADGIGDGCGGNGDDGKGARNGNGGGGGGDRRVSSALRVLRLCHGSYLARATNARDPMTAEQVMAQISRLPALRTLQLQMQLIPKYKYVAVGYRCALIDSAAAHPSLTHISFEWTARLKTRAWLPQTRLERIDIAIEVHFPLSPTPPPPPPLRTITLAFRTDGRSPAGRCRLPEHTRAQIRSSSRVRILVRCRPNCRQECLRSAPSCARCASKRRTLPGSTPIRFWRTSRVPSRCVGGASSFCNSPVGRPWRFLQRRNLCATRAPSSPRRARLRQWSTRAPTRTPITSARAPMPKSGCA